MIGADLQERLDKQTITAVLYRYCRGVDCLAFELGAFLPPPGRGR